jgi:hypothetical protein
MWISTWRHKCGDKVEFKVIEETDRNPIVADGGAPVCLGCGERYRLGEVVNADADYRRPKKSRSTRAQMRAKQMELF